MSTWTCVQLEMTDADVMVESLEEMGFNVYKPNKRTEVYADGRGKVKADLLIKANKNKNVAYDIGFNKKTDGSYDMVVSYTDRNRRIKVDGKTMTVLQRLKQLYGAKKVLKYARQRGFMLSSKSTDTQGRIKIKLSIG